jgi:hypothetical protein
MFDGPILTTCLLAVTLLAAAYFVFAARALTRSSRSARQRRSMVHAARVASGDVPEFVSRGETFERRWGGSEGYETTDWRAGENWADRLIVPVFSPFRPSEFQNRSYWTSYLPMVVFLQVTLFGGIPILALLLLVPSSSGATSFSPTAAQRHALSVDASIIQPAPCAPGAGAGGGPVTAISADNDGAVYLTHPGDRVAISYYDKFPPSFSSGVPLCGTTASRESASAAVSPGSGRPGPPLRVDYLATSTGTGFVYFPEPGGWAYVGRIDVVAAHDVPVVLVVIAAVVFLGDVILALRLRRSRF